MERRDPYKQKHKMSVPDLSKITPDFDWNAYFTGVAVPPFTVVNVGWPDFFKDLNAQIDSTSLDDWKTYLRFHVVNSHASELSSAFVIEDFAFNRQYLRGAKELTPRWKRCVRDVDEQLRRSARSGLRARHFFAGTESFHARNDPPHRRRHGAAHSAARLDGSRHQNSKRSRSWHTIRNKIGYPDQWRDYSSVKITPDDFYGNVERAGYIRIASPPSTKSANPSIAASGA